VDGAANQLVFSADGASLMANHWQTIYVADAAAHRLTAKIPSKANAVFFQVNKAFVVMEESRAIHQITGNAIEATSIGQFAGKTETVVPAHIAVAGNPAVAAIKEKNDVLVRDMAGKVLFNVTGEDSPILRMCLSADGRVLMILRHSLRAEVFRLE
jgi:hypothetical protein